MTVTSEHLKDGQRLPPARRALTSHKIAACIAWGLGASTTYLFVSRMLPDAGTFGALLATGIAQILLTLAEMPLFRLVRRRGGRISLIPLASLAADATLNAAGIFPFVGRIQNTAVGDMLVDVFNVRPAVDTTSGFVVAFVVGLILAGLPELLWEGD